MLISVWRYRRNGRVESNEKKTSANKNVIKGLIVKARDRMVEGYDKLIIDEVNAFIKTIKAKEKLIEASNEEILGLIDEENMEEGIEEATAVEVYITRDISQIEGFVKKYSVAEEDRKREVEYLNFTGNTKPGVNLPKICIKKFMGDPTACQQFDETFDATVHKNENLSGIEKFSYLKGYLGGAAEKCLEGLTLTGENYFEALKLLKERFGNPQLTIASHMNKLLKLEKVKMGRNVKELRNLFDQIESHVRSLSTVGVQPERVSGDIKLHISRKLGRNNWKIEEFMNALKDEITARESCDFMKAQLEEGKNEREPLHFTTKALFTGMKKLVCAFCKQNHFHDRCTVVTDLNERKEIVHKNRLCFKCLFRGLPIRNCHNKRNCFKCKSSNHHTAICEKVNLNRSVRVDYDENNTKAKEQISNLVSSRTTVLLQTAYGLISDNTEKGSLPVKILLDAGSQSTYVSERIVKKLNLKPISSQSIIVNTFGSAVGKASVLNEYSFCVKNSKRLCNLYFTGFAVPFICSPSMNRQTELVENLFPVLQDLDLSDVNNEETEIELLIGADCCWSVVEGETKRCSVDGLTAINSKLGWVLSGPYECEDKNSSYVDITPTHAMLVCFDEDELLSKRVEQFWDLDTVGITENESTVYEKFLSEVKFVNCRYEVRLPFKEDHPLIEDNYMLSLNRLKEQRIKLDKDKHLLEQYDDVMKKQLQLGIIEEATTNPVLGEVTYLPHRAVIRKDRITTKLRVVFDASAKLKGPSLNECLYKGPSLNPLLFDVLLRFRVSNIGLTADIEATYLQISIPAEERDYLRFLWYRDVKNDDNEIVKYRFTRVIFDASCSQFLLNGVVKLHAENYSKDDPKFANTLLHHLYVDDFHCSINTAEEGFELYKKVKLRFLEGNFTIRKWRANNKRLRALINEQEYVDISKQSSGDKVLGIIWKDDTDKLVMNMDSHIDDMEKSAPTKRNVLKVTASIYDPLGFIQPFTVKLKILFQEICASGVGWDEEPSKKVKQRWRSIGTDFRRMKEILIPRCHCAAEINDLIITTELHGFSDASETAYGACIYLKFTKTSGRAEVVFVAAKSRIAPKKKAQTIPRLELLGNLVLSKFIVSVSGALQEELNIKKILLERFTSIISMD